jgi:hypothetical protein
MAIAWSLDPHHNLSGSQVAALEKVLNEKVDQLLIRESFSKGVVWTNIQDKGGLTKTWIYNHVSKDPSLCLIPGYWPLPITDEGIFLKHLWTIDWEGQMTLPTSGIILKCFDSTTAVMYNLTE